MSKKSNFPTLSFLPNDIILNNILFRLPATSIGRYRCLSKTWNSMLSTPQFIKNHLTHITKLKKQSVYLICRGTLHDSLTLIHAHHLFDEMTALPKTLNFDADGKHFTCIVGSCNGLVLVGDKKYNCFLINPTIQQITEVPSSPFALHPIRHTVYGLGYDSLHDDHKIVAISFFDENFEMSVHIYSVNKGTWKKCESSPFDLGRFYCFPCGVFFERAIHWMASPITNSSIVILSFNFVDEKFYLVPALHCSTENRFIRGVSLVVLGECLCFCYYTVDQLVIWMMKEYGIYESWTKLVIPKPNTTLSCSPVGMMGRDAFVIIRVVIPNEELNGPTKNVTKLVAYNLEEKTFRDVLVNGMENSDLHVWTTYMETLVSPCCSNQMGKECQVKDK